MPYHADIKQFEALKRFRREIQKLGLVGTFSDVDQLQSEVMKAIEYDIHNFRSLWSEQGGFKSDLTTQGISIRQFWSETNHCRE